MAIYEGATDASLQFAFRLLAEATTHPPDKAASAQRLARLALPALGDWCIVDIVEGSLNSRQLAIASAFEGHEEHAHSELLKQARSESEQGSDRVIKVGEPELVSPIVDEDAAIQALGLEHSRFPELVPIHSYLIVPLSMRGAVEGTMTFISSDPLRRYGHHDLVLAMNVARIAAFVLENGRLYRDSQKSVHFREDLAKGITHDVKAPLSGMLVAVDMLERMIDKGSDRGFQLKMIGAIRGNAARICEVIQSLPQEAGAEEHALEVDRNEQQVGVLISEALDGIHPLIEKSDVRLNVEIPSVESKVVCDREWLLLLIRHLVANALRVTSAGRAVYLRVRENVGRVHFTITDAGKGMPSVRLQELVESGLPIDRAIHPFLGSGPVRFTPKGVVDAFRGEIRADCAPGVGCTVAFSLPSEGAELDTLDGVAKAG